MWMDPIELAAMQAQNQKEADRRGIKLQELLEERYRESYRSYENEKPKFCRPKYKAEEKTKSILGIFKRIIKWR